MSKIKKFESVMGALKFLEKASKNPLSYKTLTENLTKLKNFMEDEWLKILLQDKEHEVEVKMRLRCLTYCVESNTSISTQPQQPIKIDEEAKKLEAEASKIQNLAEDMEINPINSSDIKRKTDELALKQRLLFLKRYFENLADRGYNKISYEEAVGCLNKLIKLASKS